MKFTISAALLVFVLTLQFAYAQGAQTQTAPAGKTQTAPASNSVLKNDRDKISYSVGLNIGSGLKTQQIDLNIDMLARGIKDAMGGGKALLTDEEVKTVLMAFQNDLQTKQKKRIEELAVKNKTEGAAFLSANKSKEGVKTTASGLQYKVIKEGTGAKPKTTDTVEVHYKGTLMDGTIFDSSYERNEPATFGVGQVIKGWTEALQLMPVGSKYQIWIPSELAYGESGAGDVIGPNAPLVFEVELLSIKKEEAAKQ